MIEANKSWTRIVACFCAPRQQKKAVVQQVNQQRSLFSLATHRDRWADEYDMRAKPNLIPVCEIVLSDAQQRVLDGEARTLEEAQDILYGAKRHRRRRPMPKEFADW